MRSHLHILVALAAMAGMACEEVPTPGPDATCWPVLESEHPELCISSMCLPPLTSINVEPSSGARFVTTFCPTPEQLAAEGKTYDDYGLLYQLDDAASDTQLYLSFGARLCEKPLSAANLAAEFEGGTLITRLDDGTSLRAPARSTMTRDAVQFVDAAAGHVHLRFAGAVAESSRYTEIPACVNSSHTLSVPAACECVYGGPGVAVKLDVHAPVDADGRP